MSDEVEVTETEDIVGQNDDALAVEQEAKMQGWVPQDDWKGPPVKWVPADEFVKRGKDNAAILRERLEHVERQLLEQKQVTAALAEHHKGVREREFSRAIAQIKAERADAAKNLDTARMVELDDQLDEVKELKAAEQRQAQAGTAQGTPPEVTAWYNTPSADGTVPKNWYNVNPVLTREMDEAFNYMNATFPGYTLTQKLQAAEASVKARHPVAKENPMREAKGVQGGNGGTAPGRRGKTYADLPAKAKAACDMLVRNKILTKDQYLREYEW